MGQRANLIIIEGGRTEVFYTHWRANTLPRDLFWGPSYGTAFARSQQKVGASELLDEVWGEGGAVINSDKQLLLLFGGEDIAYDVPLRRLYLRLLANTWPGWQVQWAYEGVCDLADSIGVPRQQVLTKRESVASSRFIIAEPLEWAESIASLKLLRGRLLLFPIQASPREWLCAGPDILESNRMGGVSEYQMKGFMTGGGFHIDEVRQSIELWTTSDAANIVQRVSDAWSGWKTTWYQDQFEFQVNRTDGRFQVEASSEDELLHRVREMLLMEEKDGAVDRFLTMMDRITQDGQEITDVNPRALRDARLSLSSDVRARMIDDAIGKL